MKGILLKDLYIAKSGIIVTLTALFVLAFGLSFLLDASSILMLAPAISTVAVYMSITNDASSKWNKNVITMPVSRDQIIGAKYILYLLLSAIGIIVVLASLGIMSLLGMTITLYSLLFNAAIGISAALFAGGISLPCVYFFDAEKSQIVYMIAFVASTGIITALVLLINLFIRQYPFGLLYCTGNLICLFCGFLQNYNSSLSQAGYNLNRIAISTMRGCPHGKLIIRFFSAASALLGWR